MAVGMVSTAKFFCDIEPGIAEMWGCLEGRENLPGCCVVDERVNVVVLDRASLTFDMDCDLWFELWG